MMMIMVMNMKMMLIMITKMTMANRKMLAWGSKDIWDDFGDGLTWGRLVSSDEGKVEILFEVKSKERRIGKLFWKVLQHNWKISISYHIISYHINLGSRGNEFLAKLRKVREAERGERSNSSACFTIALFTLIIFIFFLLTFHHCFLYFDNLVNVFFAIIFVIATYVKKWENGIIFVELTWCKRFPPRERWLSLKWESWENLKWTGSVVFQKPGKVAKESFWWFDLCEIETRQHRTMGT